MSASSVRFTMAGIRYTVRAAAWGTPSADAATLAVLRAGAARQDVWHALCQFASAQLHRPVAPAELESILMLLGRRGRIFVTCEPTLWGAAPAMVLPVARPVAAHHASSAIVPTPTTLRVVNDAGQSFEGQAVTLVCRHHRSAQQYLLAGPLMVDREGGAAQWQLGVVRRDR